MKVTVGQRDDRDEKSGHDPKVGQGRLQTAVRDHGTVIEHEIRATVRWTGHPFDPIVPDGRNFQYGGHEKDGNDDQPGGSYVYHVPRVDRSTDGPVPFERQHHGQPGTGTHERVLEVRNVDDRVQPEATIGENDLVVVYEGDQKRGGAEEEIGHGQSDQARLGRSLDRGTEGRPHPAAG